VDDPIATALREAQRELRRVVALNKARKARLANIARDRLGYQEYLESRDAIDKSISNLYAKLQKKDAPKLSKKKKKPLQGAAAAAHAAAVGATKGSIGGGDESTPNYLPPCPAALGLTPDEDNHLTVNEQLKQLVETRRQWVDTVGSIFDEKERECPGRIYGLPQESIYKGIEEEIEEVLRKQWAKEERPPNNSVLTRGPGMNGSSGTGVNGIRSRQNGNSHQKGKEKARGDAMDIG
jgi:transcriptional adapter 3